MTEDQFNESLCKDCIYCVRRTIIPLYTDDFEDWQVDLTDEDRESLENGGTIAIEHVMCLALSMELDDHIVLSCNKFSPEHMHQSIINDSRVFM
jgi:hypothetical protein